MRPNAESRILAWSQEAAANWSAVFPASTPLETDQRPLKEDESVVDISEFEDHGVLESIVASGARPVVVSLADPPPELILKLTELGFSPYESSHVWRLASVDARTGHVTAALLGPRAVRAYSAVAGTATADISDVGVRHRTVVVDDGPLAGTLGERLRAVTSQQPVIRVGSRPLVRPMELENESRVAIDDGREHRPVVAVYDLEPGPSRIVSPADVEIELHRCWAVGGAADTAASLRAMRRSVIEVARGSSGVVLESACFRSELDRALLVTDMVSRCIPVVADEPTRMNGYLGPKTIRALEVTENDHFAQRFDRDRTAVRQHRAFAQDMYSVGNTIRTQAAMSADVPAYSVILATIRSSMVDRAIEFLNRQTYPRFEVVVALHGQVHDSELARRWVEGSVAPLKTVHVPEEETLGMVYNRGAMAAEGEFVVIWDDDDYYGPDHVWDLELARFESQADIVGKAAEFIYLEGPGITIQRSRTGRYTNSSYLGGSNLALGRRLLSDLGGFAPLTQGVDTDMIARIRAAGGQPYRQHPYGYLVHRRTMGHTWNPGDEYFLQAAVRQWPGLELTATGVRGESG